MKYSVGKISNQDVYVDEQIYPVRTRKFFLDEDELGNELFL